MSDLRTEFTQRWEVEQRWSYESGDDSGGELWSDRDTRQIALEMLEADAFFWEHRGWDHSLLMAISPAFAGKEASQRLAQKLLANAPLGYADINPRAVKWANDDFSECDQLVALVEKTQPEWLDRLAKNRAARESVGV